VAVNNPEGINTPVETEKPHTEPQNSSQPISEVGTESEAKAFIYRKESSNRTDAVNKSSGACGLGQRLPCSILEAECPDWRTDYACSDKHFTNYMLNRYGSWANAKSFWLKKGWW